MDILKYKRMGVIIIFEVIDMKNKRFVFMEVLGAVVVSAMAVIFHNLYDMLDRNFYIGLFTATNESIFEHIKIIYFPYLIWAVIEFILLKPQDYKKFLTVKAIVLLVISMLVVVFYYTYVGVIGYNIMAVDIGSAFVYVILGFIWSYRWISSNSFSSYTASRIYLLVMTVFVLSIGAMIYFSINPIKIPLFYDTESGIYGMKPV